MSDLGGGGGGAGPSTPSTPSTRGILSTSKKSPGQRKRLSFGTIKQIEIQMEVGGCGVPEDGGFPVALGSKVLREVVVPVVASPGAEDMGGGSSPSPSPSPSTSPTAGAGAKSKRKKRKRKHREMAPSPAPPDPLSEFQSLSEDRRKRLAHEWAAVDAVPVTSLHEDLGALRAQRMESERCDCRPPRLIPPQAKLKFLMTETRRRMLTVPADFGSKSAGQQRNILLSLLRRNPGPPMCSKASACRCHSDGGPCGSSCPCLEYTCGNRHGTTNTFSNIDIVQYRRGIIRQTRDTGDLFSPAKEAVVPDAAPSTVGHVEEEEEEGDLDVAAPSPVPFALLRAVQHAGAGSSAGSGSGSASAPLGVARGAREGSGAEPTADPSKHHGHKHGHGHPSRHEGDGGGASPGIGTEGPKPTHSHGPGPVQGHTGAAGASGGLSPVVSPSTSPSPGSTAPKPGPRLGVRPSTVAATQSPGSPTTAPARHGPSHLFFHSPSKSSDS